MFRYSTYIQTEAALVSYKSVFKLSDHYTWKVISICIPSESTGTAVREELTVDTLGPVVDQLQAKEL